MRAAVRTHRWWDFKNTGRGTVSCGAWLSYADPGFWNEPLKVTGSGVWQWPFVPECPSVPICSWACEHIHGCLSPYSAQLNFTNWGTLLNFLFKTYSSLTSHIIYPLAPQTSQNSIKSFISIKKLCKILILEISDSGDKTRVFNTLRWCLLSFNWRILPLYRRHRCMRLADWVPLHSRHRCMV